MGFNEIMQNCAHIMLKEILCNDHFFQHITQNIDETYAKCGGQNVLVGNIVNVHLFFMGPNSLKCTKIFSHRHPFLSFLPSPFLPCEDTFIDNYDGS